MERNNHGLIESNSWHLPGGTGSQYLLDYKAQDPRREPFSYPTLWEPEISHGMFTSGMCVHSWTLLRIKIVCCCLCSNWQVWQWPLITQVVYLLGIIQQIETDRHGQSHKVFFFNARAWITPKRLNWAKNYKHLSALDWRKVLFSDGHFEAQGLRITHLRRSGKENVSSKHM